MRAGRRSWALAAVAVCLFSACPALAHAADRPPDAVGAAALIQRIQLDYVAAARTHDPAMAGRVRSLEQALQGRLTELGRSPGGRDPGVANQAVDRIGALLSETRVALQPWPFIYQVQAACRQATGAVGALLGQATIPAKPYAQIKSELDQMTAAAAGGRRADANFALASAYALYANRIGPRLGTRDPLLGGQLTERFWQGTPGARGLTYLLAHGAPPAALGTASKSVRDQLDVAEQVLGDVTIARATVVADAAIIVFREGLEAVLILAAITASFVGAKRALRKPVLIGGLAGVAATILTWGVAQTVIQSLGGGGLRLQAITGVLAIGVLLLVTNWFFHRVYWSQWIARFNRQRRTLERFDRVGFLSGQLVGLVLLGLTSVYREGFETVLFLQSLQVSAGTAATALGAGIGLVATMAVGVGTFLLQRSLPYRRMLVLTGVLITVVLAIMVGTTMHNLQGLGWMPLTSTGFRVPLWCNMWLGFYGTWETIVAQASAVVFVVGSYVLAREIQVRRPRRRALRRQRATAPAT